MLGTITFGGTDYNTTGAQTYIADTYSMTGANPDFNTDNDNISFEDGGITLATISNLEVNTGSSTVGNINIEGAIAGTSGGGNPTHPTKAFCHLNYQAMVVMDASGVTLLE